MGQCIGEGLGEQPQSVTLNFSIALQRKLRVTITGRITGHAHNEITGHILEGA